VVRPSTLARETEESSRFLICFRIQEIHKAHLVYFAEKVPEHVFGEAAVITFERGAQYTIVAAGFSVQGGAQPHYSSFSHRAQLLAGARVTFWRIADTVGEGKTGGNLV